MRKRVRNVWQVPAAVATAGVFCTVGLVLLKNSSTTPERPRAPVQGFVEAVDASEADMTTPGPARTDFSDFRVWLDAYSESPDDDRDALVAAGIERARARSTAMRELIARDPRAAIEQSIGYHEWHALPQAVQALVERPFSETVEVNVLPVCAACAEDEEHICGGREEDRIHVRFADGTRARTRVYGWRHAQLTRMALPAQGIQLGDVAVLREEVLQPIPVEDAGSWFEDVHSDEAAEYPVLATLGGKVFRFPDEAAYQTFETRARGFEQSSIGPHNGSGLVLALMLDSAGNTSAAEGVFPAVQGVWTETVKTAVLIRVDFSDRPVTNYDHTLMSERMNTVSNFYDEMSWHKTGFASTIDTNVYRMSSNSTYYADNRVELHDEAMAAAGVTLDDYDHVLVLHGAIGVSWSGFAYIGGQRVWLRYSNVKTIAHELGHNFGLYHANRWLPPAGSANPVDPTGSSVEYGDNTDNMGRGDLPTGHFSARQKRILNWLELPKVHSISTSATNRIYRMDHGDTDTNTMRAVEVYRNAGNYYHVGYRQLWTNDTFQYYEKGIQVLWVRSSSVNGNLLDLHPGGTINDAGLPVGETWSDTTHDIHITPIGRGGTTPNEWIDVAVNYGPFAGNLAPTGTLEVAASGDVGEAVVMTVSAGDPNGDELSYFWDFSDGVVHPSHPVLTNTWNSAGIKGFSVTVSDRKGGKLVLTGEIMIYTTLTERRFTGGNGDPLWGRTLNWDPNDIPDSASEAAVFDGDNNSQTRLDMRQGSFDIAQIVVRSPATVVGIRCPNNPANTLTVQPVATSNVVGMDMSVATKDFMFVGTSHPWTCIVAGDQRWDVTGGGDLSVESGVMIDLGSDTLSLNVGPSRTVDVQGVVMGTGNLTKTNEGTVVLGGANTYSGMTTVHGGTLDVDGSIGGTGTVTVGVAGTLSGNGTVAGAVTVVGTVDLSGDVALGTLSLSSNLTLEAGSALTFDIGVTADSIAVGGAVTTDGAVTVNLSEAAGMALGTYDLVTGTSLGLTSDSFALGSHPGEYGFALTNSMDGDLQVVVAVMPGPDIGILTPLPLDFGVVGTGTIIHLSVTVTNGGDGVLNITNFTFGGSSAFSVLSGIGAVAVGATTEIAVQYEAGASVTSHSGTLYIWSDDPNDNPVSVGLRGDAVSAFGTTITVADINDDMTATTNAGAGADNGALALVGSSDPGGLPSPSPVTWTLQVTGADLDGGGTANDSMQFDLVFTTSGGNLETGAGQNMYFAVQGGVNNRIQAGVAAGGANETLTLTVPTVTFGLNGAAATDRTGEFLGFTGADFHLFKQSAGTVGGQGFSTGGSGAYFPGLVFTNLQSLLTEVTAGSGRGGGGFDFQLRTGPPAPLASNTLEIVSAHGSPNPTVGVHTNDYGASVTNSVATPADEAAGQRWACTGWAGTGSTPASGTANSTTFTITADSTLTWQWTNEYELAVSAGANGSVNGGVVNGWYTNGVAATGITATPDGGYLFAGWMGDVPPANTNDSPLDLTMDQARTVVATFAPVRAPHIGVTPSSLDFGTNTVGSTSNLSVMVTNSGDAVLNITNFTFDAFTNEYSVLSGTGAVAVGGSTNITVQYAPTHAATHAAILSIWSDDSSNNPKDIPLTGAATVRATGYYVATNGNNTWDGSLATPWATVQYGVSNVMAGDTLYIRGGVYNERVTLYRSGSAAGGYITVTNYAGETPVIDGTGITVGDTDGLITFNSQDYITLDGLEIRDFITATRWRVPMGVYINGDSSFIRLRNLKIHRIESNYDGGGSYVTGADAHGVGVYGDHASNPITNLVVRNVEIHDCKLGSSEALVLNGNIDGFEVTGCTVHDNDNIGIDFIGHEGTCSDGALDQARNGICTDNLVYNINTTGNPAYRDGGSYDRSAGGIYVDGGKQIVIERNTIHDCDIGLEVASEHSGKYASYITVRNNLICRNYTGGIFLGGYDSGRGNAQYCTFIGNTLYHNDTAKDYTGEICLQWHISDCEFENNLIVALKNEGGDAVYVGGSGGSGSTPANTRFDYNWYYCDDATHGGPSFRWGSNEGYAWSWWRNRNHETNGTYDVDPLLVSATNGHLQASSGARDAGRSRGDNGAHDMDGETRIMGMAPDIGADELLPDSDGDGILDAWEMEHWNSVTNADETTSSDTDPHTDLQEFIADTDPTNAASYFRIKSIGYTNGVRVCFDSSSGRLYRMRFIDDLQGSVWSNVPGQEQRFGLGPNDTMTDTNAVPQRYYRLEVERP